MGFLTNVSISNDFWHQIAKDPQKLVDAISIGMNDGTESVLGETLDARSSDLEYRARHRHYLKYQVAPQGVIVHHARHYDEPQIIVNAYGRMPVNAAEIPSAIEFGWLDLNEYNARTAEAVATELEEAAERIRLKLGEALERRKNDPQGISRDKRLDRPRLTP
jgi:hypothetical protein